MAKLPGLAHRLHGAREWWGLVGGIRPIGWYVRVWVGENEADDPAYDTALYIAGYPTPAEAEAAVRRVRPKCGERLEVLAGGIAPGIGPQPKPGAVTRLRGAV
jgi:hypothetical protein